MNLRIFGLSYAVTAVALLAAFLYGGVTGLVLCAILGILEISLSFDNAVVNATVLERMDPFWQRIFLTVGVLIAVFGMRLVFPLIIVGVTAHLNPIEAFELALQQRPATDPTSYAALLNAAYPQIAAFGGTFLLMLFLDWLFDDRDIRWLSWLEKPLAKIGQLSRLSIVIALVVLVVMSETLATDPNVVLTAGALGLVTYLLVNGLGEFFDQNGDEDEAGEEVEGPAEPAAARATSTSTPASRCESVMVRAIAWAWSRSPAAANARATPASTSARRPWSRTARAIARARSRSPASAAPRARFPSTSARRPWSGMARAAAPARSASAWARSRSPVPATTFASPASACARWSALIIACASASARSIWPMVAHTTGKAAGT